MNRYLAGCAAAFVWGVSGLFHLAAAEVEALGIRLERFEYPFEVSIFSFQAQQQELEMAYMDVRPEKPNGETVMLLHGKNFS